MTIKVLYMLAMNSWHTLAFSITSKIHSYLNRKLEIGYQLTHKPFEFNESKELLKRWHYVNTNISFKTTEALQNTCSSARKEENRCQRYKQLPDVIEQCFTRSSCRDREYTTQEMPLVVWNWNKTFHGRTTCFIISNVGFQREKAQQKRVVCGGVLPEKLAKNVNCNYTQHLNCNRYYLSHHPTLTWTE